MLRQAELGAYLEGTFKVTEEKPKQTKECMVRIGLLAEGPRVAVSLRSVLGSITVWVTRRQLAAIAGTIGALCRSEVDDAEVNLRTHTS